MADPREIDGFEYTHRLRPEGVAVHANALGGEFQPRLLPTQYALIHAAHAFCLQLEQAGLPEGECGQSGLRMRFAWGGRDNRIAAEIAYDGRGGANGRRLAVDFRVGDPLPAALVAAIRESGA